MEVANEVFILQNTYFIIMYSDLVLDAGARYTMGWVNLGMLIALVVSSAGLVLINQVYFAYRAIKLRW